MKISILLTDGAKQIMMTPENDHERDALKMIGKDDTLKVVSRIWGGFGNDWDKASYKIAKCQSGYYRPFEDRDSLMFVIEDDISSQPPNHNPS
jgi:hypothetical protein